MLYIVPRGQSFAVIFDDLREQVAHTKFSDLFLGLAVGNCHTREKNFCSLHEATDWIHRYREFEAARQAKRCDDTGTASKPLLPKPTILLLLNRLPYLSKDTAEEYGKRQDLLESGVLIIEREPGKSDEHHFEEKIAALQAMTPRHYDVQAAEPPPERDCASNWELAPPPKSAKPFGKPPIDVESSADETLKGMFDAYFKTD